MKRRWTKYDVRASLVILLLLLLIFAAAMVAAQTEKADASDGTCIDAETGEAGLSMADGACMTPTLYDATFSPAALAEVPSLSPAYGTVLDHLIANGTPLEGPASDRSRTFMEVELPTFRTVVYIAHGQIAL